MRGLHFFLLIYYFLCLYKWFDALGNWTLILAETWRKDEMHAPTFFWFTCLCRLHIACAYSSRPSILCYL